MRGIVLSLAIAVWGGQAAAEATFQRIATQYIAALGDPMASSGADAQIWGHWAVDPGPRGVRIAKIEALRANGNQSPDGWGFDPQSWWLEEHGLLMEAPVFPLPPGQYVVTGGREVTSVLTVAKADTAGQQAWSLADGATVYDVTHLGCRAALYRPAEVGAVCAPEKTPVSVFPMAPGIAMPAVEGCSKQDYQVLIVVGMLVED